MRRALTALLVLVSAACLAGAAGLGYLLLRDRIASGIYRERLVAVTAEYNQLAADYNLAVTRAAVTELLVEGGAVAVQVRSPSGPLRRIQTPYSADSEIFLDYVVLDGKLWIRRVFDDRTAPREGIVIDPALAEIDWDAEQADHGKVAYRSLADGRWVVSVSGDGSVGLKKAADDEPADLVSAPEVKDFDPLVEAEKQVEAITWRDVLAGVAGELPATR
ncbi:hypothetical protein [Phycisphaera mikurensis]|uniref:Uncharacterized protein n=1 Tax=Phycisphaera mikurensis (strain NBRC 102666 / KCTC 22515 / FYK2301M01) TaxID=1142394 RepID=I0IBT0_PHYMF|nr:hypothetical protein [Phycisphaera mikurensis]MBB6442053.1 hypothetical protein [Phycisphaera mikurensis]BAM02718.1 hypothetical protein PSMK_05590 [Phycisphaera mikurensis NBRC 102666]